MKKNEQLHQSMDYVFRGGVATSAMDSLAVGSTLTAYALLLGAGPVAIGILGAVPFIGNMIHLLSSYLIEKGISAKKIALWSSFLARPFYLIAAALCFFQGASWAVPVLIISLLFSYLIGSVCGGVWMPWMKELIPARMMGRFFSHRFKWMMIAKIICFIFAFILLKIATPYQNGELYSYAFLIFLAFLISIYGACTFFYVEDKKIPTKEDMPFVKKVAHTFQNKPFSKLLTALSVLNFATNFLTPFLTVFMLKNLNVPMSTIIVLTLLQWLVYTFVVKKWGKMSDRKGPEKILIASIPIFVLCALIFMGLNIFSLTGIMLNAVLVLVNILLGVSTAALALGINNTSLLYMPKNMSSVYLSVNSVFKSFAGALGSIMAGYALIAFEKTAQLFEIANKTLFTWNLFYVTTIILCILSIYLLKKVKKCA
ncbi:MAG: MFS transporter [Alphaproteobacteria bacterium]|nr:MFS transporter [Alphaproteobacteria bacterium]